jgi:hypothetical protein
MDGGAVLHLFKESRIEENGQWPLDYDSSKGPTTVKAVP